ncbi:hypothetical protein V6N12_024955 [Hibiscus sabdariffa]|uniref:Uncharacterized protein n=1 Tax=Hibiscus sabdariffa TaxID=183260 RepID=A0ABR2AUE4_9ROSI
MRIERGGAPKMDCHADASNDLLLPIIGNKLGDEDFDSWCGLFMEEGELTKSRAWLVTLPRGPDVFSEFSFCNISSSSFLGNYCGSSSTSVSHSELVIGDKANPPIDVEEISHIELEVHAGFGPW